MKFWALKTIKDWVDNVLSVEKFIGIDQPGAIDKNFRTVTDVEIDIILKKDVISRSILRSFYQFAYDMKEGDSVVIGTGSTTSSNVKIIRIVESDYKFSIDFDYPRHYRKIKIVYLYQDAIPYEEFNRSVRLEFITEQDWDRMIARINK